MKKLTTYLASISLFSCIGFSAFGDDLDIYLGNASNAVTYNPNVLFIMDSSGSMGNYDNTSQTRMLTIMLASGWVRLISCLSGAGILFDLCSQLICVII